MESGIARQELEAAVVRAMEHASTNVMRWGFDDCVFWAAMPICEALGYDPVEEYRGKYSDRDGALTVLGTLGLGYALRRTAKKFGWRRISSEDALIGDVGLSMVIGTPTAVLCRAPGWFLARNENGYTALKSNMVRIAWSVA